MTSKLDKCDKASPCINNIRLAPDGGYGWFIVLAYGTANVLIVPVLTSFGLIFKDKFQQLNMSALDATLILNLNSALGMTLGLFNGVLLKCFGYRKIAILGGSLFSGGLVATSFADSFQHFLITYSIITSIGMGLCTSSFSLALNSYFKERRNKAFGIGATITGIGPIFLPQLVSLLLAFYGTQGCVLIIGAIAMHIIAAALLLQPVKRYQKILRSEINSLFKATPSISGPSSINAQSKDLLEDFDNDENQYLDTCPIYHDIDQQSIYGFEITQHPVRKSEESIWSDLDYKFQTKTPIPVEHTQSVQYLRQRSGSVADTAVADAAIKSMSLPAKTRRWFESGSNASVNLESSWGIFHEDDHRPAAKAHSRWRLFEGEKGFLGRRASFMKMNLSQRRNTTVAIIAEHYVPKEPEKPLLVVVETPQAIESESPSIKIKRKSKRFQAIRIGWGRFVRVFDLGLLNDPIYLNMMFGISLAVFSEINFSLLTPFILDEFNYSTKEIAIFMSSLASADILCRFISPFIGDYFKQPPRIMYMYALFMLIVTRTCLLFAKSYQEILFVAIGLGIAKGVRSVYMSLVVPSYVPLERLAAASGIQMVANGILILMMGSFVGVFKDLFGSYSICIIFINCITFITLVLWTIELVIMKRKNVKRTQEMKGNEVLELCKFNIEVN